MWLSLLFTIASYLSYASSFTLLSRYYSLYASPRARRAPLRGGNEAAEAEAMSSSSPTPLRAGSSSSSSDPSQDPLLVRMCRGEAVERVPVWMMRQAGRHMQVYRDLCKTHKTFRERSENADVATEISLQPWRAYQTDGCILFSDILTPLPGMGVEFDILEGAGPKMAQKYTSETAINSIKTLDPATSFPYIGEILRNLRREVGGAGPSSAAVLGFIGLPYTMATYMVEGGSSSEFRAIKEFGYAQPKLLHTLLDRLTSNLAAYAIYQIESGAQVIQVFDSWAGNLSPEDYDTFAAPYQRKVIAAVKKAHPEVPIILYINKAGALLEKMADSGADIVSLDWTVTIPEARRRMGGAACKVGIQGNLDPMVLYAPKEVIKERTEAILQQGGGRRHVMNLGHGIDSATPEENAKYFIDVVKNYKIV